MSPDELEALLACSVTLQIYTHRIKRFIEGRVFALHWPAAPDSFLIETMESASDTHIYIICAQ